MDILVKLTVPNYIYRFYDGAAAHIAQSTAEDIMSDALSAYACMISEQVAKLRESPLDKETAADEPFFFDL